MDDCGHVFNYTVDHDLTYERAATAVHTSSS